MSDLRFYCRDKENVASDTSSAKTIPIDSTKCINVVPVPKEAFSQDIWVCY